ncbi:MAG: hypothetical protein GWM87_04555 [Xanthomonadales bacterium]|nr:hypothetical protein [Xanthomonadales bacterium]NIX12280.1 hypothetical protein [Xanthomonadales bacterium]
MKPILPNRICAVPLALACMAWSGQAFSDTVEDIRACAKVADAETRLACYDELGARLSKEDATAAHGDGDTAADEPSLPDHLGGADFEERSETFESHHRGVITSCQKGPDSRWYFIFNNGQIWKQSNASSKRRMDCEYPATITRDGFGYFMEIQKGDKTDKIRVRRVK